LNPIKFQLTQQLQDPEQPVLVPGHRLPDIDDFPVLNATLAENILSVGIQLSNELNGAGLRFCEAQGGGCMRDPLLLSVPSSFPTFPFPFPSH